MINYVYSGIIFSLSILICILMVKGANTLNVLKNISGKSDLQKECIYNMKSYIKKEKQFNYDICDIDPFFEVCACVILEEK